MTKISKHFLLEITFDKRVLCLNFFLTDQTLFLLSDYRGVIGQCWNFAFWPNTSGYL